MDSIPDTSSIWGELQLYARREILTLLRRAGFRAKTIPPYGGMEFPKGYCAFMAWKK